MKRNNGFDSAGMREYMLGRPASDTTEGPAVAARPETREIRFATSPAEQSLGRDRAGHRSDDIVADHSVTQEYTAYVEPGAAPETQEFTLNYEDRPVFVAQDTRELLGDSDGDLHEEPLVHPYFSDNFMTTARKEGEKASSEKPELPPIQQPPDSVLHEGLEVAPLPVSQDDKRTEFLGAPIDAPILDTPHPALRAAAVEQPSVFDDIFEVHDSSEPSKRTIGLLGKSAAFLAGGVLIVMPAGITGVNMASRAVHDNTEMTFSERLSDGFNGTIDFYKEMGSKALGSVTGKGE